MPRSASEGSSCVVVEEDHRGQPLGAAIVGQYRFYRELGCVVGVDRGGGVLFGDQIGRMDAAGGGITPSMAWLGSGFSIARRTAKSALAKATHSSCFTMSALASHEIVEHYGILAGRLEGAYRVAADVAGTAGNQ